MAPSVNKPPTMSIEAKNILLTPPAAPQKQDPTKAAMDKVKNSPVVALFKGGVPIGNVLKMDFRPNLTTDATGRGSTKVGLDYKNGFMIKFTRTF